MLNVNVCNSCYRCVIGCTHVVPFGFAGSAIIINHILSICWLFPLKSLKFCESCNLLYLVNFSCRQRGSSLGNLTPKRHHSQNANDAAVLNDIEAQQQQQHLHQHPVLVNGHATIEANVINFFILIHVV